MLVIGALKNGQQTVVIPLRNGVKLVFVALGAFHGEPEYGGGKHLHLPVNHLDAVGHKASDVGKGIVATHAQKTRGGKILG